MSNLSGYDSEVVGFESVGSLERSETSISTQTNEVGSAGVGSQSITTRSCGANTDLDPAQGMGTVRTDSAMGEYPSGLNEFLRRVVPAVMQELDEGRDVRHDSTDSEDDEEELVAKVVHEVSLCEGAAGDMEGAMWGGEGAVLAVSWGAGGSELAVSVGRTQHETWCTHTGVVRVYSVKRGTLTHARDIRSHSCVSAVRYHPRVRHILACGDAAGDVRIDAGDVTLRARHGAGRVADLLWPDTDVTDHYLTAHVLSAGERRARADSVLLSAGSDGTVAVWRVNVDNKVLESIAVLHMGGSSPAPDITCLDCVITSMERESATLTAGTKSGAVLVHRGGGVTQLQSHLACMLHVSFCRHEHSVMLSLSIDGEMRLYRVTQPAPIKVIYIDSAVSCACWMPSTPGVVVVGVGGEEAPHGAAGVRLYDVCGGRRVPLAGAEGAVTAIDVCGTGASMLSCAGAGRVRVCELPHVRTRTHTPHT